MWIVNRVDHHSVSLVAGPFAELRDAHETLQHVTVRDPLAKYEAVDEQGMPADFSVLDAPPAPEESWTDPNALEINLFTADEGVVAPAGALRAPLASEVVEPSGEIPPKEAASTPSIPRAPGPGSDVVTS